MEYIILGKTKLRVSRIGFGGWGIAGGAPIHPWKDMWKADDTTSKQSLQLAYTEGINFFDTALVYIDGHSERLIAHTLKGKNIIIETKVPPLDGHWPAFNKDIRQVFPKKHIIDKAMESYVNLGRRTIDILLLHGWLDDWYYSDEWREAFSVLKKERIARYFGVSVNEHNPASALLIADSGEIDVLQVIYNIFDQSPYDVLFPIARKKGVGIIARAPLDEGSLAGAFHANTVFDDWRKDYFTKERLPQTVERVNKIKKEMENKQRTMTQIALRFCLEKNGADVAIVGMRNPLHVKQNCQSVLVHFTKKELDFLKKQRWIRNFYPPIW